MGRKGNSRFPAAKIKKIIQQNQEIGKLCNSIPPIVERSLQMFLDDIMENLTKISAEYGLAKLSLKLAVQESEYDFMKDVLEDIVDLQKNKKKTKRSQSQNKKGKQTQELD